MATCINCFLYIGFSYDSFLNVLKLTVNGARRVVRIILLVFGTSDPGSNPGEPADNFVAPRRGYDLVLLKTKRRHNLCGSGNARNSSNRIKAAFDMPLPN